MSETLSTLSIISASVLAASVSPGPDFLYVTFRALQGRFDALLATLGVSVAATFWATISIGIQSYLKDMPSLTHVLMHIGVSYLTFIGVRSVLLAWNWKDISQGEQNQYRIPVFLGGVLVGITNPKSIIFFNSLFLLSLPPHAPVSLKLLSISAVFLIVCLWFSVLSLLFSMKKTKALYKRAERSLVFIVGVFFILLSVSLILS